MHKREPFSLPTGLEVPANLRAGAEWMSARDVPDVVGLKDFISFPELTQEQLEDRIYDERCPLPPSVIQLPKPGSSEIRKSSLLDPYDDLYLRICTGRVADVIEAELSKFNEVFSYRLREHPPGWRVRRAGDAHMLRRRQLGKLLAEPRCRAMGLLDIRNYYSSIDLNCLSQVLARVGAAKHHRNGLMRFLCELSRLGEFSGIPIGPEASGLLGNVMLISVDEQMRQIAIGYVRYSDDSWVFLDDESRWVDVISMYEAYTNNVGLRPNSSKLGVYQKRHGEAQRMLDNETIAYIRSIASHKLATDMALDELSKQLSKSDTNWSLVSFLVGTLRLKPTERCLTVLYDNPKLFCEIPCVVAKCLLSVAKLKKLRRLIDRDWFVNFATVKSTARSEAAQIHACRVLSELQLGKRHGQHFEELAHSSERTIGLRAWAAIVWGKSQAHLPGAESSNALEAQDFSLRRAFTLTIDRHASNERYLRRDCKKLSHIDLDLAPTLAYVQSRS